VDAARTLELAQTSDVLLLGRFASVDLGSVALSGAACGEQDVLGCARSGNAPARVSRRGLAAGRYRVVAESVRGLPATLTAAVRPARAPTLVPAADDCDSVLTMSPSGGFFQGNTANAGNDFSASCDFATPTGSPDQMLRLVLDQERRVVLDMRGSDFDTLLNVRQGPGCPGEEVARACSVISGERSFLDVNLPAGEYFVQVDGYAGAFGSWFLDVFVIEP
jgi:hypothetical protein